MRRRLGRLFGLLRGAPEGVRAEAGRRTVCFRSTDGLLLEAHWTPAEGSPRVAVLAHGRRSSKLAPYVIEATRIYHGAGLNVLALDLRGRGGSEGRFLTGGYQEVRDVRGALRWLEERGFDPADVVLHGWSTGAVAVLRAAPESGVGAVVEESGYADLPLLLGDFLPGAGGPSRSLSRLAATAARLLRVDFDPWEMRQTEDAARLHAEGVPLMVIHSPQDGVIPLGHAGLLVAAHPDASFWEADGCEHSAAFRHPEYEERLLRFLGSAPGRHAEEPGGAGSERR